MPARGRLRREHAHACRSASNQNHSVAQVAPLADGVKRRGRPMMRRVHPASIRAYAQRIARVFSPRRIILFGSHARGEAGPDADVDLLVVFAGSRPMADRSLEIRQRLAAPFPLDLLTRSEGEIARRLKYGDFFLREILEQGVVLYESTHPRVGAESRG